MVVDLDGTLIKNDLFLERLVYISFSNPLVLFWIWIHSKNYVDFKTRILRKFIIKPSSVIYNELVLKYIADNRHLYSKVILLSASPHFYVEKIAIWTGQFDLYYGSSVVNLKGIKKVDFLKALDIEVFDYIGNSKDDLPIYSRARRGLNFNGTELCEVL